MNLFDFIKSIWDAMTPLVAIYSFQGGVRWTFGRNPKALGPGVHFKLWPIQEIEVIDVVETYLELPVQSIITKDKRPICFSVVIAYKIVDTVKHFCEVNEFEEALEGIAAAHLARKVREKEYDDILSDLKRLEDSLSDTLTTKVKGWGTEILSVGFKDLAEVVYQGRLWGAERLGA